MSIEVVVLDTDVWSHLFARRDAGDGRVAAWRESLTGRTVAIAVQTRAEVLSGILQNGIGAQREARILTQLDRTPTIPVDEAVVRAYAELAATCKARGHALWDKIHTADRWVAASAIAIGAPLLSGDEIFEDAPALVRL